MAYNDHISVGTSGIQDSSVTAAKLSDAVADIIPTLTVTAVDDTDGTATVTIQAKDAQGNNLADRVSIRTWTSGRAGADMGAPASILTDYSSKTGTDIEENVADADYTVLSDANGVVAMDANDGLNGTLWFMAELGGFVASDSVSVTGT